MAMVYRGHNGMPVHAVRWSPDGTRIASASRRRGESRYSDFCDVAEWIEWWLRAADRPQRTEEDWHDEVRQALAEGNQGEARIWEAETGATLMVYRDHPHGVNDVAWSPDGTRIASGGWDRLVRIWEAGTGQQLATYEGHCTLVTALAWSPDGRRIAS